MGDVVKDLGRALKISSVLTVTPTLGGCLAVVKDWQPPRFTERGLAVANTQTAACPDWRNARVAHPMDWVLPDTNTIRNARFGCVNDTNLVHQVADPRDLETGGQSRPFAAAPNAASAAALQRYYADKLKPLPRRKTSLDK